MDYSLYAFVLSCANFIGVWFVIPLLGKIRAAHSRIDELEREIESYAVRINLLEEAFKHSPKRDDLRYLHERINEMQEKLSTRMNDLAADIHAMSGEFKAANHTIALIHQNMLNRSKSHD